MTVEKKETINIPKWIILFLVPALIGGMSGIATGSFSYGKKVQQIETLNTIAVENKSAIKEMRETELKELRDTKADKTDMDKIYNSLIRIEGKFDQHIVGARDK